MDAECLTCNLPPFECADHPTKPCMIRDIPDAAAERMQPPVADLDSVAEVLRKCLRDSGFKAAIQEPLRTQNIDRWGELLTQALLAAGVFREPIQVDPAAAFDAFGDRPDIEDTQANRDMFAAGYQQALTDLNGSQS